MRNQIPHKSHTLPASADALLDELLADKSPRHRATPLEQGITTLTTACAFAASAARQDEQMSAICMKLDRLNAHLDEFAAAVKALTAEVSRYA